MDEEELYFLEDDEDEFAPLEEELFPITLTRNEVLFLDDSLTMLIEQEGYGNVVTTMRMLSPTAQLPAPVSLIDKILNPLSCNALKAVSRPDPGPLTSTDKVFIPNSKAFEAAASAAI